MNNKTFIYLYWSLLVMFFLYKCNNLCYFAIIIITTDEENENLIENHSRHINTYVENYTVMKLF